LHEKFHDADGDDGWLRCMSSFGVMPLEVTPSPGVPPSSALSSVNSHVSVSSAAQFKVLLTLFSFSALTLLV